MNKKFYTKEEFMQAVGINNRSRLHQILFGYKTHSINVPPKLEEGKDFIKTEYVFFESAIKKLKKKELYVKHPVRPRSCYPICQKKLH